MNPSTHRFFQCNTSANTAIRLGNLPPFAFLGVCWRQRLGIPRVMASPSELFSVKTRICVKKESRYGQGRGSKLREQFRKYLKDVVNIVVRTRNGSGHDKRYSLAVRDIYGIGRLPFLVSLIATTLPTTKSGGVTAVQFHAGHVQERPITVQNDAPHLLPFTISRPFAEMPIHSYIMQHPPCEERWDRKHVSLTACLQLVEYALNDFIQVTFWDIPTFCHRQMRQNFKNYCTFVQYFVHEGSVYLGFASQR